MSKHILKNKLLKDFVESYNRFKFEKRTMSKRGYNLDLFTGLLAIYMKKKTKSTTVKRSDDINDNKCILIKCTPITSECKYKKIKQFFSMNYDDIIHKVPNAKDVEKELKDLIVYLGLENKIEVTATYNKELYYSFRMTVTFLNEEQEKIKERENKILKNVDNF
jgi:hypothetical protein